MERPDMNKTPLGLLLIGFAVLFILAFAMLTIATGVGLLSQKSLTAVFFYGGLGAHILAIVGYALCLTSPREAGKKGWLFASLGLFTAAIAAGLARDAVGRWLAEAVSFQIAIRALFYYVLFIRVLELFGLACFLVWLRSLALHMDSRKYAKHARDLIQTGAAIAVIILGVGTFVLLREPPVLKPNETDAIGLILGLIIPGTFIGLLMWLFSLSRLLFRIRRLFTANPREVTGMPAAEPEAAAASSR